MQVLKNAVIINASPSQRELLRDPKYRARIQGAMPDQGNWSRPHIPVSEIAGLIQRLQELKPVIMTDPDYSGRKPSEVIDRIILNIEDAAAAQRRAYQPKISN
jgi:hypothetical protein